MSATGLDVFDKTLQTTNTWLGEIADGFGGDRQLAWHILSTVLRTIRDRLPIDLASHLGAQLPLLVRGVYYDQFVPSRLPEKSRTLEEFLERVDVGMEGARPVNTEAAVRAVFEVLVHHVTPDQMRKVRDALPADVRDLCPDPDVRR